MTEDQSKARCPNKAVFIYPWAGKLMKACAVHANAMAKIGAVIGSPIEVQPIITEEMCQHPNDLEEFEDAEQEKPTE